VVLRAAASLFSSRLVSFELRDASREMSRPVECARDDAAVRFARPMS